MTLVLRQARPTRGFVRRITLTLNHPVSVGRSSRSESKNLSATVDNALFDCPVISRKHAEIEFTINRWTTDQQRVTITDKRSMHGTSVNGTKLKADMPFQLEVGDTIRLGDHISRADNTYDGITLEVDHIISSASQSQPPTTVKNKTGISFPSDDESEDEYGDDDSIVEEVHSAHTTPENAKPTSYPNIIDLDDEDDEDVVETAPSMKTMFTRHIIPDTFEESQGPHAFGLQHIPQPAANPFHSATFQEMAEDIGSQQFGEGEDDDDDENDSWSNQDQFSAGSDSDDDNSSSIAEPVDIEDFEEDVDDDEDEDDAPEVMSSKRQPSQEIGTLGEDSYAAPVITRSHYDPVRGFQVSVNENNKSSSIKPRSYEPTHTFTPACPDMLADSSHSSKWDMGPSGFVSQDLNRQPMSFPSGTFSGACPPTFASHPSWVEPLPNSYTGESWHTVTSPSAAMAPSLSISQTDNAWISADTHVDVDVDAPPVPLLTSGTKRKANDISEDIVPVTNNQTEPQVQSNPDSDAATNVSAANVTVAAPVEPVPKKRKIKQPRTNKSYLKTAATEAGKYAAGALVGSVGLVALLASPLGARLAEC